MKLLFKGKLNFPEYHGQGIHAKAGEVVDVEDAVVEYLLTEFPGVWTNVEIPKAKDVAAALVDKQIKKPFKRK